MLLLNLIGEMLVELLFSLPRTVERIFSLSNIIKTDRWSLLSAKAFDNLNSSKIPLSGFVADQAVDLWWTEKSRRLNQTPKVSQKTY